MEEQATEEKQTRLTANIVDQKVDDLAKAFGELNEIVEYLADKVENPPAVVTPPNNAMDKKIDDLAEVVSDMLVALSSNDESTGNAGLDSKLNKLMKAVSIIGNYTGNNRALELAGFTQEELHVITKKDLSR